MIEKICPVQYSEDITGSWKPIHTAAEYGQLEVLKYIFNQIDDKAPKTHDGQVPLHRAVKGDILENCEFLINNVSDIDPVDKYGFTPLHRAVLQEHLPMCHLLLESGANKSFRTAG